MSISDLELSALKSRVLAAVRTNSSIANVESHIQQLKGELPNCPTWLKGTPATEYLHSLVIAVEKNRSEGTPFVSDPPRLVPEPRITKPEKIVFPLFEEAREKPPENDPEVTSEVEPEVGSEEASEAGSEEPSKRSRKNRHSRNK
jgi:hypothetical protein